MLFRITAISPLPVEQQRCPEQDSQKIPRLLPALMQSLPLGKGEALIWISQAAKQPHGKMKFGDLNCNSPEFACDLTPRAMTDLDTYRMRSQRTHCVLHTDTLPQHFAWACACSYPITPFLQIPIFSPESSHQGSAKIPFLHRFFILLVRLNPSFLQTCSESSGFSWLL